MRLRSVIGAVSAVAMVIAQIQPTPAFAQATAAVQVPPSVVKKSTIIEAFAQYPQGGDLLAKQLADIIVANPNRAAFLVKYIKTAQGLSFAQKVAAERGLARALERLGVKAADLEPPPPQVQPAAFDYSWLALALLALVGIGVCVALCFDDDDDEPEVVTPHDGGDKKLLFSTIK
jgi:hypothetical protein